MRQLHLFYYLFYFQLFQNLIKKKRIIYYERIKILAVVVILTLITYWGVEPLLTHKCIHVSPANFKFEESDKVSAKENVEKTKKL